MIHMKDFLTCESRVSIIMVRMIHTIVDVQNNS